MRRLMIVALLLLPLAADARPFSTGSRWGSSLDGPGFAPMQRVSVGAVAPEAPRDGLLFEYILLPKNWHYNGGAVDVQYDTSGNEHHASQPSAVAQPVPATDSIGLIFPSGTGHHLLVPYDAIGTAATYTLLVKIKWLGLSTTGIQFLWDNNSNGGADRQSLWTYQGFWRLSADTTHYPTTDTMLVGSVYFSNTKSKFIFNGVKDSTITTMASIYPTTVGTPYSLGTGGVNTGGRVSNMVVYAMWGYNRELSQEEIEEIGALP